MTETPPAHPALTHCPNCQQLLVPPGAPFCAFCGQEAHARPPTLMEFAQQFGGTYISTEGALWRSLRQLLTKPGQLTLEYWSGRRKHFVLPLRLYLTVSLLALLMLKLTGSAQVDARMEARFTEILAQGKELNVVGMGPLGQITLAKGVYTCTNLPDWVCKPVEKRMQGDPAVSTHWLLGVLDRASDHLGQAMFVLLPLFAVWTKLLYWPRKRYYTEHLVLALHLHAFWFLMLMGGMLPLPGAKAVAWLATLVYPLLVLQRVFAGAVWKNLLRGLAVLLLHGVAVLLVLYALLIWALVV